MSPLTDTRVHRRRVAFSSSEEAPEPEVELEAEEVEAVERPCATSKPSNCTTCEPWRTASRMRASVASDSSSS